MSNEKCSIFAMIKMYNELFCLVFLNLNCSIISKFLVQIVKFNTISKLFFTHIKDIF